jgi:hypothetical protein
MTDRDSIHLQNLPPTASPGIADTEYDEKKHEDGDSEKKDLDGYGGDGRTKVLVTEASDVHGREKEVEELEERLRTGEATNDEFRVEGVSKCLFQL